MINNLALCCTALTNTPSFLNAGTQAGGQRGRKGLPV
jgi:hypothetical protein